MGEPSSGSVPLPLLLLAADLLFNIYLPTIPNSVFLLSIFSLIYKSGIQHDLNDGERHIPHRVIKSSNCIRLPPGRSMPIGVLKHKRQNIQARRLPEGSEPPPRRVSVTFVTRLSILASIVFQERPTMPLCTPSSFIMATHSPICSLPHRPWSSRLTPSSPSLHFSVSFWY